MQRQCRWCRGAIATAIACAVVGALASATAIADSRTRLINVDTARVLENGQWQYGVDFRTFGDADDEEYVSGAIKYAMHGYQLELLGSFASVAEHTTPFTTLRYGGTNWEVRAKKVLMHGGKATVSGIVGIEFPNTPAQDEHHLAIQVPLTIDCGSRTSGHIVPKFVFLEDNTVSSLGLAVEHKMCDKVTFLVEFTPNIGGENTRDRRGDLSNDSIWGVAFRWMPCSDKDLALDFGFTNGKGQTDSFGVAPGILNSGSLYFAATWTR